MPSIKILLVDDEDLARERLRLLVQRFASARAALLPALEILEAADGVEAIERIKADKPDVVLLDVQMPEVTGFDVLLQFPDRAFEVVFQTAYSEFAVKAFEVAAADYLLKPFPPQRLDEALARAIARAQSRKGTAKPSFVSSGSSAGSGEGSGEKGTGQGRELGSLLADHNIHLENVAVRAGSRVRMVPVAEIQYFLSEDHVTQLFTKETSYACDPSLSALEERLDPRLFIRVHRNAIVNVKEISSFTLDANAVITLRSGATLKVSRERKKDLKALLGER